MNGDVGRILRLKSWRNYFRPPRKDGPRPEFLPTVEQCTAHKGRVLVVVILGDEPADGSEPLDVNAALESLGWKPPTTEAKDVVIGA